jgi:HSP20 family protein
MQGFRDQINQWLESFSEPGEWWDGKTFSPTCDVEESDNEIVVKMDVPGINEKEISLTLSGNNLIIKGERKSEADELNNQFRASSLTGSLGTVNMDMRHLH